jgi:hypothetical protein
MLDKQSRIFVYFSGIVERKTMLNNCLNNLVKHKWFGKLTATISIVTITSLIGIPVLAIYPRYSLFQPRAYLSYPFRGNAQTNIADALSGDSKYQNLVAELKAAGLFESLKAGNYTIFAPSDAAFNALPRETYKKLSQGNNRLKLLQYHLVARQISTQDLDRGTIETLEGQTIQVKFQEDGMVKLNDANGIHPSGIASNGVIIEVDRVLLPPDL